MLLKLELTIFIGLDNGLAPTRLQTIIWTNDGLGYLTRPQWVNAMAADVLVAQVARASTTMPVT